MTERIKILVVDDDPYLLDLLIETLTTIGYDAVGVPNADEALQYLHHNQVRLVITDIKLPGKSGLELAHLIKNEYPQLPVIFITGVFTPEIIEQIDTQRLLTKPFRIGQMENLIKQVINEPPSSESDNKGAVLVVDDDDSFRIMLMEALKLSGYPVLGASDSGQAISLLQRGGVRAVIADLMLPGMNGVSLGKLIRNHWPDLPLIFITAYLTAEEQQNSVPVADGFLMKPFKIESITNLLENLKGQDIDPES